ncbi:MAG TPA: serine hydrolase domain-containing protein [Gemmatimonadaceae bacterium]|jgi:Beta-lactamase class C and other penicillin binding proteins
MPLRHVSHSRLGSPRSLLCGVLASLVVAFAPVPASAQAVVQVPASVADAQARAVDTARARVREWVAKDNLPGASVAVGIDGQIVWAEGFGWADLEQRVPVTSLTRFRIGSVSKPLTSVAVGLLYERGKVDLDAPVQKYVPSFPKKRWPISTRQLMGHVAGLRHYRGDEFLSSEHYDNVLEGLEIFAHDSLLFRPGTAYSYSTYGWNLVSAVVESAAGEPFLDFMRREVFAPLGLRHTVPGYMASIVPDRVRFYEKDKEGRLVNAPYVDNSYKWAGGGFLSTPSDLVRFGFGMLDNELLKAETRKMLWTPLQLQSGKSTGYGLGWGVDTLDGHRVVSHGGGSVGGTTAFMIFPDQRMVVAVTTNLSDAEVGPIANEVAKLFMPAGKVETPGAGGRGGRGGR